MKLLKQLMRLAIAVLFIATLAHGQATVNETLETSTLYVDAVNGSDSNPGTQGAPLQTITKALTLANASNLVNIGTKILVNPGTYREAIVEKATLRTTSLPITLEAVTPGTAILSGADIFTDWTQYSGNASIYTAPWTENYGFCPSDPDPIAPYLPPIVLRREMVYINSAPMTQVLDLAQMVYPGTFYVDDSSQTIYVWPYTGVDINAATVEIATRGPEVTINNYSNFVLRGMTIQYDNTCHNNSAVYVAGVLSNILIDNDTFQWNNSRGLNFQTANTSNPLTNITVQNSQFLHNGQAGATDFRVVNSLWQNDTFNYNNWRGALGSYYSWASSGMYFEQDHTSTETNLTFLYNQTNGIHWDTDNIEITASGLVSAGNLQIGLFFEKNEGPITFTGGVVADNLPVPNVTNFVGGGVIFRNSENIIFENTQVFGGGNAQLTVEGQPGGIPVVNWQTGQNYNLVTSKLTLANNILESTGPTTNVFADGALSGADWTAFLAAGYSSTGNTWWNTQGNPTPFVQPVPGSAYLNFPGWQAATGQDANSVYEEPSPDPVLTYTLPTPDAPDYWLVVNNTMITEGADGTAAYTIYSIPVGAFAGTLNLSLVGLSDTPGLTGTISANSINQSGSAVVILTAATSVPAGIYQATVVSNSGTQTHAVTFNIVVGTTFVRIAPATLAFPSTESGASSLLLTTLTNTGAATLSISGVTISAPWSETNTCGGTVNAGASCTFSVVFTPNGANTFVGSMTIADSDPTGSQNVSLTGTGTGSPIAMVSPLFLSYGPVVVGSSAMDTTTLTNTGQAALTIDSMAITGLNASEYTQTNTCGTTVQPGASCIITVTFLPAGTGPRSASLTITDNALTGTQTVGLSGSGSEAIAILTPTSVAFGNQVAGTMSVAHSFTLKNSGAATLNISSISLAGSGAAAFTQTNTCGNSVAAYGSCTISVIFDPASAAIFAATLVVTDNSTNSTQNATLNGTGIAAAISVTPTSLLFPGEIVGTRAAGMLVTVLNASSSTITMGAITIAGTNSGDFSDATGCGVTLGAGRTCTVTVFFTPTATGVRAGSLNVATLAPKGMESASLSGTGMQPGAMMSETSLDFGTVKELTNSGVMTATLTNTGTATLTIVHTSISGANGPWFAQTNTCGNSVAAGASCTFSVTATPKGKTTATGILNIKDNATGGLQTVTLTVTGD